MPSDDEQAALRAIKKLHDSRYSGTAEPDFATLARDYLGNVGKGEHLRNIHRFYADHVAGRIKGTPSRRKSDFEKLSLRAHQVSTSLQTVDILLLRNTCLAVLMKQENASVLEPENAGIGSEDDLLGNSRVNFSGPFDEALMGVSAFLDFISCAAARIASNERPRKGAPKRAEHLHTAFEQLAHIWRQVRKQEPTFSMKAGSTLKSRHFGAFVIALLCFGRPQSDIDHVTWSLKDWLTENRKASS